MAVGGGRQQRGVARQREKEQPRKGSGSGAEREGASKRDYSRFFQDEVKKELPSQKVCVPFLPTPDRKSLIFRQIRIFPKLPPPPLDFLI